MLANTAPFDYVSLVMIICIAIPVISGFFEGGFKGLAKILSFGLAIGLAYALYQPVGNALIQSAWGEQMRSSFVGFAVNHINIPVIPGLDMAVTGNTSVPRVVFESAEFRNLIYDNLNLTEAYRSTADAILLDALSQTSGLTVSIAEPVGLAITKIVCFVCAFAGIVAITFLGALLIIGLVSFIRKLLHKKIGFLNRMLGVASGLVSGFIACWIIGLIVSSLLIIDSPARLYLQDLIGLNDPAANGFAKWFLSLPLGYDQILQGLAGGMAPAK